MATRNKVAIVTGAGRGIGRVIALRLARDGFDVVVNAISSSTAKEVSEEIKALGLESLAYPADVSDQEQVFQMVAQVEKEFGQIDVMVANAGILQVKPLLEINEQDLDKLFRVNVYGVLYAMQAAAEVMIKQRKGKIINASSIAGKRGSIYLAHYAATKAAIIGLTKTAAKELAPHGITVNAYCPGVVRTQMWDEIDEEIGKHLNIPKGEVLRKRIGEIALGRMQEPEDVANFVSYLASDDSDYMTGQAISIDGGIVFS